MTSTARDLMTAIAERRDRQAFAALFESFAPRIKSYLMRTLPDPVRCDEVVQEVMLTVWRRAETYDSGRAAVSTWIFAIARNARVDAVRKERRPEVDPDDPALVRETVAPEERVDALRRQEELHAALEALPDEQAAVLRGAYFDGKTLRAIAEESEIPLGTVKSRVRLALARLRQAIGLEGAAP